MCNDAILAVTSINLAATSIVIVFALAKWAAGGNNKNAEFISEIAQLQSRNDKIIEGLSQIRTDKTDDDNTNKGFKEKVENTEKTTQQLVNQVNKLLKESAEIREEIKLREQLPSVPHHGLRGRQ